MGLDSRQEEGSRAPHELMPRPPTSAVLLAAGRGSRLAPLTDQVHKSLLPIAGRPALARILDEVLARGIDDVVVVTGDKRDAVEAFVRGRWASRVRLVHNERFAEDTNILSTDLGVEALARPEAGYWIIETDLVVEPAGWARIFDVGDGRGSYWITRGRYGPQLTGGALRATDDERVSDLVYSPRFDPAHAGYQKLIGVLYVGADEAPMDRRLRRATMERTIAQYYMMPWVENLPKLPCRARDLEELFAASFNDLETYRDIDRRYASGVAAGAWSERPWTV